MNKILDADGQPANGLNGRFKLTWEKILTWAIAALLAYGTVNARVAVLESRVDGLKSDVSEIRSDVKTLLYRTR
jgi:hypothetical protein